MTIGTEVVYTPFAEVGDDPVNAHCDWPNRVYSAALRSSMPFRKLPKLVRDSECAEVIEKLLSFGELFLDKDKATTKQDVSGMGEFFIAERWKLNHNGNDTRDYLDALLLTGAPYEIIARSMDPRVTPKMIETYEKLHYHCRDKDGKDCTGPIRKRVLAFGNKSLSPSMGTQSNIVKAVSLSSSYTALTDIMGIWNVPDAEDLDDAQRTVYLHRQVTRSLVMRLHSGGMDDEYLASMLSTGYTREKMEHDMSSEDVGGNFQVADLLMALFGTPNMLMPVTPESVKSDQEALDRKRLSSKNIAKVKIDDSGPAAASASVSSRIRKHLEEEAAHNTDEPKVSKKTKSSASAKPKKTKAGAK